jgi:hypothetical protein
MRCCCLSELVDYRKIHGHCNVPRNSKNIKLAMWVKKQRSLGFEWSCVTIWEDRLGENPVTIARRSSGQGGTKPEPCSRARTIVYIHYR